MACAKKMGKYTLVITEKPSAAQRIALALDTRGAPQRKSKRRVPYYVARRDGEIVVVSALGHLYNVAAKGKGRTSYPIFDFEWVPVYVAERGKNRVRSWLDAISDLARDADVFIDACDYDTEGSIIGYNIIKYACGNKEANAKRMKYSTLTEEELNRSYATLLPHLDFALIEAGLTKHEIDWLYGINLSRALTVAAKNYSGNYATLSTGRVQGPTLEFIVSRERSIRSFVPTPFWEIRVKVEIDGKTFEAQHEKEKIETKQEATNIIRACEEKEGQVERVNAKQYQQASPTPFDLSSLQREAYRVFGYAPRTTANIAQHLYLEALISYPRTSSQKLPSTIGYEEILRGLNKVPQYRKLSEELLAEPILKPNEGKKQDPAHPAIYPTGKVPARILARPEKNTLDLITRRFMAVFGEPAIKESTRIVIEIGRDHFNLTGDRLLKIGWRHFYEPFLGSGEHPLPLVKEGQLVTVKDLILESGFTKPLPRFNPSSILKEMEKAEIGTKATRADIVQTLYDREYIKNEKIELTELGLKVYEVLEEHCPTAVSVELTRGLEEKMNSIQMNNEKRERVIADAVEILKPVMEKLRREEKAVGEQLSLAVRKARMEKGMIGSCPTCHTGKLITLYSRKTGKRFIGCTNYFKGLCRTSFPLPQKGRLKPTGKTCYRCGWPTILVITEKRHNWTLCFNQQCPSKKEGKKRVEMQNM